MNEPLPNYGSEVWQDPPRIEIKRIRGEMAIAWEPVPGMRIGGAFIGNITVEAFALPDQLPVVRCQIEADDGTIIALTMDDSSTRELMLALYEVGDFVSRELPPGGIGLFHDEEGRPLDHPEETET